MSTTKKTTPSQSIGQWLAVPLAILILYLIITRVGAFVNDDQYHNLLARAGDPEVSKYSRSDPNLDAYYISYMNCTSPEGKHGECDVGILVDHQANSKTVSIIARRSRWNDDSDILCEETIPITGILPARESGQNEGAYAHDLQNALIGLVHSGRCSQTDDFETDSSQINRALLRAIKD